MTQNTIDQTFITACGGVGLFGMSYINQNQIVSASGQNDVYTVPTGRRAIISGVFCNSQSSASSACCFKVSGTYYNGGGPSVSLTAGTPQNLISTLPLILEAGETLSVFLTSAVSVNVWPQIIEVDANCPVKSGKFLNATSGNNLVYTCPTGKTAMFLDQKLNFGGISATGFGNFSSTTQMYWMYVPNGQSPASTFRFSNTATPSGSSSFGGTMVQSATRGPSMNAGDMIYVNANSTNGGCAFFNVVEF